MSDQQQQVVVINGGSRVNHLLHFALTVITCGAWLPFWVLICVFRA